MDDKRATPHLPPIADALRCYRQGRSAGSRGQLPPDQGDTRMPLRSSRYPVQRSKIVHDLEPPYGIEP
jgi:hypothetical protein